MGREAPPNVGSSQQEPSYTDSSIIIGTWVAYGCRGDYGDGTVKELEDSDMAASYKFVFDENGRFELTIEEQQEIEWGVGDSTIAFKKQHFK